MQILGSGTGKGKFACAGRPLEQQRVGQFVGVDHHAQPRLDVVMKWYVGKSHAEDILSLPASVGGNITAHLLKEIRGKHEFIQSLVGCGVYLVHVAHPFAVSLVDEYDILAYTKH